MTTFTTLLQKSWNERPDKAAVHLLRAGKPDVSVSTRDLLRGAAGYADLLSQNEVKPGDVVILILQHGLDHLYAYFGTILTGAVPSIMPFLTEKLLPERYRADLASLVEVTHPAAIITYPEFESEVCAALPSGSGVRVILTTQALSPRDPDFPFLGGSQRKPEDTVLLQHSSGTTGLQKGVALSHQAVLNQLSNYSKTLLLNSGDVVVSWLPLYHDMGLIAGLLMPILMQVPLVLLSPFDWVRAPVRLLQAVSRYKGTLTWLPNFAFSFCAQKIRERDLEGVDLASWRAVINCSEPIYWESQQAFLKRFQPYGLNPTALGTCYAMAENVFAVTQSTVNSPSNVDFVDRETLQISRRAVPVEQNSAIAMVSSGRPIDQVQVKIVDPDGNSLPERTIGEIALKSNCMLTGYYHRPEVTAKAFLDGWYLTGDFGYFAEGELFVTGRKKDLIIVGGKNIFPQDLENLAMSVAGVHPGRVVAFGVFNEEAGTEEVHIVAEVDSSDGQELESLGESIRRTVSQGSAIAVRGVHLVSAHWLVKTSSGKVARSANRDKYLQEILSS